MNRQTPLLHASNIAIERFDHPGENSHRDPAEEIAEEYSVSLVQRGRFSVQIGRTVWDLERGDCFLTFPQMVYRCRHCEDIPTDSCLTVSYRLTEEMTDGVHFARIAGKRPIVSATNRLAYLFRRIPLHSSTLVEQMVIETSAADILAEICAQSGANKRLFSDRQLFWYTERIDFARCLLEKQYAADHSLASLARSVGMSTFHFVRVFGELAGTPPHRYLLRVRMREAAQQLRQGASVTEAGFNCGFRNVSHFVRTFQRWFGVSPAEYARERAS